jgi:hypothetical protein
MVQVYQLVCGEKGLDPFLNITITLGSPWIAARLMDNMRSDAGWELVRRIRKDRSFDVMLRFREALMHVMQPDHLLILFVCSGDAECVLPVWLTSAAPSTSQKVGNRAHIDNIIATSAKDQFAFLEDTRRSA